MGIALKKGSGRKDSIGKSLSSISPLCSRTRSKGFDAGASLRRALVILP
ncbi:MAG: hypothetical protein ACK573_14050 [Pseudanabaena sp.]